MAKKVSNIRIKGFVLLLIGVLCALILQQIFPMVTGSQKGWLSQFRNHYISHKSIEVASYSHAVKKIAPAVVHIFTTLQEPEHDAQGLLTHLVSQKKQRSLGSGVIVGKEGYILTNYHVIAGKKLLLVALRDGRQVVSQVVGIDTLTDLAVLKIHLTNLVSAQWISSRRTVHIGDVVLAIGNPFGIGQTVTNGIISAKRRRLNIHTYENFLQTDAVINVGNSGGALVNTQGRLVGIATALLTSHGGYEGLGFVIPADLARFVLHAIVTKGKVVRGWIGIEGQALTSVLAKNYGLHVNKGVLIANVYPGSPAEKAGLKRGDVILRIDKHNISDIQSMISFVATLAPGSKINMRVLSGNIRKKVRIVVVEK